MVPSPEWLSECWSQLFSCWNPSCIFRRASDLMLEGYRLDRVSGSLSMSPEQSPARPARAVWFSGLNNQVEEVMEAPTAEHAADELLAGSRRQSGDEMPRRQSSDEVPRMSRRVSFDFPGDVEVLPERRSRFTLPTPPENRMRRNFCLEMADVDSNSGISNGAEAGVSMVQSQQLLGCARVLCAVNGVAVLQKPPAVIRGAIASQGDVEDDCEDEVVVAVEVRSCRR